MDKDLRLLLNRYVQGEVSNDTVRAWVSRNIWDAQPDVDDSIDQVAIRLAHLDDGIINESKFRSHMLALLVEVFKYVETSDQDTNFSLSPIVAALATSTNIDMSGVVARIPVEYLVTAYTDSVTSPVSLVAA